MTHIWGLGFGVWGLGFGVWGLGIGVWGLGFGVRGLGLVKRTSSHIRTAAANIGRGGGRSMGILFRASTLISQENVRGLWFCFFVD
jgi:hypothetical protein